MSTRKWLGMSWWNAAMTLIALVGAAATAVFGNGFAALILAVAGVMIAVSAIYARSSRASDLMRLNAIEYADERDRMVGTRAFAILGGVALVVALVVFIVGTILLEPGHPMFWVLWGQVIGLTIAWAVANVVALNRS